MNNSSAPATLWAASEVTPCADINLGPAHDTLWFLRRILPATGLYVVARPAGNGFKNQVCESIEQAAQYIRQFDDSGVAAYHACSAYRERQVIVERDSRQKVKVRIQKNVRAIRSFWMDLDVKPGAERGFASQEAAIDGLVKFCADVKIPLPLVVSSGYGIHVYWVMDRDLIPETWKEIAEGLKQLAAKLEFHSDPMCTADSARVLRTVGTWNRKDERNPRAVELVIDQKGTIAFDGFAGAVRVAVAAQGLKVKDVVKSVMRPEESINAAFAVQRDYPPCSGIKVADRCQQVAIMRNAKGVMPEPSWYATIQLLTHATEGDDLIHEWSNGHPGYSREETDRKILQIRSQNMGPTLCTTFESRNPGGCDGCQFKGKVSSPVQLGSTSGTPAENRGGGSPSANDHLVSDKAAALALVMHAPTEDNVGRLFEAEYANKLRFCKVWGSWLSWDGTCWRPERTDLAFDFARTQARAANPFGKATIAKAAFSRGVEAFARASRLFATEPEQWDRDEFLLNTPGGTVDLKTGQLRPHNPADYITKRTLVTPASGPTPVFDRFMNDITCGDQDLVEYHLQALGAMLSGARADHWLLFWIGSGRNGKNTLGDLVSAILGDYAKTIPTETLMSTKTRGHPTEIANLRGVRLAISSEVAEGAYWDETRIKSLTGDTTLTGRLMRGDFFEFPRSHKHIIYGNNRPQLRVVDDAIRARMHIVPFAATFNEEIGNRDPLMGEKLREESPQILARLIAGHMQWISNGYKLMPCDAVRKETQDYLETQSTPALWIDELCERIDNDERPTGSLPKAGELYISYSLFKRLRGEQPMTQTRWGEWMGRQFRKFQANGVRYRGIKLKAPATEHHGTPTALSSIRPTIQ